MLIFKFLVYYKFWNVLLVENICWGLLFFFRKLDYRYGKIFFKRGGGMVDKIILES